jgi:hypothetical protein
MSNPKEAVELDESQMTTLEQPIGERGEDVLTWLEWNTEEKSKAIGTSS